MNAILIIVKITKNRLKENNGKEDEAEEEKGKGKEEEKQTCDNKELSSKRRTSPRKKNMSSQSKERILHDADTANNPDSLENHDSFENHDSDPELPPPVPVLPPVEPATSTIVTDASKLDPPTGENDTISGTEDANTITEATLTDTSKQQNCEDSEEPAPEADLFAVGQNAGKSGSRKKLNRISVDRLEVPPAPPRRSSRRRPPSESPSGAPPTSSARSLSPSKSPSKRKARGRSRRFEDEEEEEDDEPSALHPAQLPLPIEESPPLASDKSTLPVPLETNLSETLLPCSQEQLPHEEAGKSEKAAPLKISLASGFSALAEKVGPAPAPVHHSDLEPYVESEEEKEKRERKRMEDKQFLEDEKRRLEEEKKILEKKVLEKKKREEEKEAKKQAEIAPARKGAADFFDNIIKEASEELREADAATALAESAIKDDTRTVKLIDGGTDAGEVEGGEKVQITEQRRIKRISLDKGEEEMELKCALCTAETKCSVCELQKPPSRPSSRAEKVLRQETRWRRERSGEREDESSRQKRREERSVRRREKRQRSSERSSSSYLSDLMKEGRMRCDEEGSTGKVTRMDGRIRIQEKVAADKRTDNK